MRGEAWQRLDDEKLSTPVPSQGLMWIEAFEQSCPSSTERIVPALSSMDAEDRWLWFSCTPHRRAQSRLPSDGHHIRDFRTDSQVR